jgi:translocation and assembly module TamA
MPILQYHYRPRRLAATLLALLLASSAVPAAAEITVEVNGVAEDVRKNILAYLSFERYKENESLTPEIVERLQERSEREVRAAMRPFGYYEPKITSEVKRSTRGSETDYDVIINVVPGEGVVIDKVEVNVTGPGATDKLFTDITGDMPVRVGERLNHSNYELLKGSLLRTAATYGFLDARMSRNEMRVDPQARTAQIYIDFDTGSRYRFGDTEIHQDVIDDSLIRRYLRYKPDQEYDSTELFRTQFALDDSQYFSTVEVRPEDRDREKLTVPINVTAEPNRRGRYQFGIGYGTDTEARGTASWENRLVNRRGHRFRTEIRAATINQSADARYIVPIGDPATEKFTLQVTGALERLEDQDIRNVNFTPSVTQLTDSWFSEKQSWQRVTYIELLQTQSETIATGERDKQSLIIPGISFSLVPRKYLGEALFSRALYGEVRGSNRALGSDSDFLQVRLQAERAWDLDKNRKWHLLLRGDFGATALSRTSGLAVSQRFFAGGDRSVRGFGFRDLSPVEEVINEEGQTELVKVGGKHLFTGSVEVVRDLPRNFAVAVFADAGNAFDQFGDPLMYSVGVGFRYRLPVVSVGLDVAQPLTTPPGETERPGPRLHLNFSPKL